MYGAYGGFQPKPAVEEILVVMKPLSEKNFIEQAMKNEKGITWLDNCRIPFKENDKWTRSTPNMNDITGNNYNNSTEKIYRPPQEANSHGRFPANLLVSDDSLNDGKVTKSNKTCGLGVDIRGGHYGSNGNKKIDLDTVRGYTDSGSFSRYFDLDAWAKARMSQFLLVPKPSRAEKEKGLENFKEKTVHSEGRISENNTPGHRGNVKRKNVHPTVKPIELMGYLVTMISQKGDTILDPFGGSGTTKIAAHLLGRVGIMIEKNHEYCSIAQARFNYWKNRSFEKVKEIKKQEENVIQQNLEEFC